MASVVALQPGTRAQIAAFLDQKRFAAIGVSREAKDFTRSLMREFLGRGYDVVPVNPGSTNIEGRLCLARVQDVTPAVDTALLLTSPNITEQVVRDCIEAGVRRVWMYRAGGEGAVSASAVRLCRQNGIEVIAGECPLMFLPNTGVVHRFHGFVRKIFGTYPQ